MQTIEAAEAMGEKPLLLVHGSDDRVVPSFDARVLADAHGSADLRIIDGQLTVYALTLEQQQF